MGSAASAALKPDMAPPLEARYRADPRSGAVQVTLRRPNTGAVVRQIPPDSILNLAADVLRWAGLVMDKSV